MAYRDSIETFNGCKTRVMRGGQDNGQAAPMLLLHGAGGAAAWLPFMEKLAQRFDLIVPEHPGFGKSDTPDWLDNIGDLAYFYLDVIDRLGLSGVHLVGTSLGGWIAVEIAVRDCHALKSLTLSAPAGIHVKGLSKGDTFLWSAGETARNLVHDPALAETMLAQPLSEEQQFAAMKNRLTTAKLAWQPRFYNPHLYKWLHRISVPTLILWGDDDKVIPPGYGPAFRDLIPGSRLATIPRCGHLPQVEHVDAWTGKIVAFIAEIAP
jgi:pimeloyl-ACP methyl ester carboxylesterase